jgi:uncharacterized DUF497 family protein
MFAQFYVSCCDSAIRSRPWLVPSLSRLFSYYNIVYTDGFSPGTKTKDGANRRKHGVSFETAVKAFDDPDAVSYLDRVVDGEERWHTLGLVGGVVILLVVHTIEEQNGEEEVCIVSARKASSRERDRYETSE